MIPIPYYYPVPSNAEWFVEENDGIYEKSSNEQNNHRLSPPTYPGSEHIRRLPKQRIAPTSKAKETGSISDNYVGDGPAGDPLEVKDGERLRMKNSSSDDVAIVENESERARNMLNEEMINKSSLHLGQPTIFPYDKNPKMAPVDNCKPAMLPKLKGESKPISNPPPPSDTLSVDGRAGFAVPGMPGVPMMLHGGIPYVVVPMHNSGFHHLQQAQPTVLPNITQQPQPQPPAPRRLPHAAVDTNKLASAELNSMKEDMRSWEVDASSRGGESFEQRQHANRRSRTVFTRHQLITLNSIFKKQNFISGKRMRELSDELGLDRKTVKIWFQNKRQFLRKNSSPRSEEAVAYPGEGDYIVYRDISSSEKPNHIPPTMTSSGREVVDDDSLDVSEYDDEMARGTVEQNEGFYQDDSEIITVRMADDNGENQPTSARLLRGDSNGVTVLEC